MQRQRNELAVYGRRTDQSKPSGVSESATAATGQINVKPENPTTSERSATATAAAATTSDRWDEFNGRTVKNKRMIKYKYGIKVTHWKYGKGFFCVPPDENGIAIVGGLSVKNGRAKTINVNKPKGWKLAAVSLRVSAMREAAAKRKAASIRKADERRAAAEKRKAEAEAEKRRISEAMETAAAERFLHYPELTKTP